MILRRGNSGLSLQLITSAPQPHLSPYSTGGGVDGGGGDSGASAEARLNFSNTFYLALAAGNLLKVYSVACQYASLL